ncbi:cation diffusion facilitator family transporter [Bacillus iocasae]|uniref:Cation diffusion facilitator family transporter n=2 Tax=Priestia iocasae TaxID=2291674 RepID=A0ABS2QRM8_9BACI|nr:cation diffusion facilitator family transporter [Metabacillus iocasae]
MLEALTKEERFKKAKFAAMIGIVGNIVLAIIKYVIGIQANSKALIADAVHSASDVAGSIAVYVGVKVAKQPPDEDHPYGHGKAESIAAIIIAVLLFIVGVEIFTSSVQAFFEPLESPKVIAIYATLFSIVVKEWMFRYKFKLGKEIKSDAVIINAYEHRSDVFSSIAALIGIGASILGGYIGVDWLVYADPVAGVFVAFLVLKMAWQLGAESIHNTLDHVLHEEDTTHLRELAMSVDGVRKLGSLHAREHGHYVIIDLKISVDPFITVEQGHAIAKEVKKRLMEEPNIQDVLIHINPYSDKE